MYSWGATVHSFSRPRHILEVDQITLTELTRRTQESEIKLIGKSPLFPIPSATYIMITPHAHTPHSTGADSCKVHDFEAADLACSRRLCSPAARLVIHFMLLRPNHACLFELTMHLGIDDDGQIFTQTQPINLAQARI
jgi:hypothetical protein